MRLSGLVLLVAVQGCISAKISFDESCKGEKAENIMNNLKTAIDYAKIAAGILKQDEENRKEKKERNRFLTNMIHLILGDESQDDYGEKVGTVQKRIGEFSTTASDLRPNSEEWLKDRKNKDLEVYCSKDRFEQDKDSPWIIENTAMKKRLTRIETLIGAQKCHDPNWKKSTTEARTTAFVMSSSIFDKDEYDSFKKKYPETSRADHTIEYPDIANTLDVCAWYYNDQEEKGFEKIDDALIKKVQTEDHKKDLKGLAAPVDTFMTLWLTLTHELSHTDQAGRTRDLNDEELGDVPSCYGWLCIQQLKSSDNGDSIAFMSLVLNLYKKGYHVDAEGKVAPITTEAAGAKRGGNPK